MKRKALFAFLALFFVLFTGIGSLPAKADSTSGLNSITVEKKDILGEGTVYQKITANMENPSTIQSLNINYKLPSGSYTQYYMGNNGQGAFDGYAYVIGAEAGTWKVTSIFVNYTNGSFKVLEDLDEGGSYDLSGGDFTVYSSDTEGPILNSITVDSSRILAGNSLMVTVNAKDTLSDIQTVSLGYSMPNGTSISGNANSIGNNQYQLYIPNAFTNGSYGYGKFKLTDVHLTDSKNNRTDLWDDTYIKNTDLSAGDFTVIPEADGPVIKSISIDKTEVASGEPLKLTAEVEDASGVGNFSIVYTQPNGYNYTAVFSHAHDNIYEAVIPGDATGWWSNYATGYWTPRVITVNDIYDNSTTIWSNLVLPWGQDLSYLNFYVKERDLTPPNAPSVSEVDENSTMISGNTEPNATITATVAGNVLGVTTADSNGYYELYFSKQLVNSVIQVTATDESGNVGQSTSVVVKDVTAPGQPTANDVSDKDNIVTGQAEAGSTVEVKVNDTSLGSATTGSDGVYSVTIPVQKAGTALVITATDSAGNRSRSFTTTVKDKTPPAAPNVSVFTDKDTVLKGTTEAGADITVMIGTNIIGTGTADSDGKFAITIPKQKYFTKILVSAKDKAGNQSTANVVVAPTYSLIKVQLNGQNFTSGYFGGGAAYVHWKALETFKIPFTYKGNNLFNIGGRQVQGVTINGGIFIRWSDLAPGQVTYKTITGGYNFLYTPAVKVQLNGKDFTQGYKKDGITYVHWKALDTFKIPYTFKGNGVFVIQGLTVQAATINGGLYIRWTDLAPGKVTYQAIPGGYNFLYSIPVKVQLNGQDFTQGYFKDGTTYLHWSALKTLNIPYTFKGGVLFDIGGRSVTGVTINGGIYLNWNQLAPGKITYKVITGGYNFIYQP
ncbi:Ig-like domain-containing protein [Neobacillus vireti]|uniref:Ig-like domain-containing protein n=1 Tax=Neobacillus vireti TaxID=220686 RepID=UPI002FFE2587